MIKQPKVATALSVNNDCFDITFSGGAIRLSGERLRCYLESDGYSIVVREPEDADVTIWEVHLPIGKLITTEDAEKIENMITKSILFQVV